MPLCVIHYKKLTKRVLPFIWLVLYETEIVCTSWRIAAMLNVIWLTGLSKEQFPRKMFSDMNNCPERCSYLLGYIISDGTIVTSSQGNDPQAKR